MVVSFSFKNLVLEELNKNSIIEEPILDTAEKTEKNCIVSDDSNNMDIETSAKLLSETNAKCILLDLYKFRYPLQR